MSEQQMQMCSIHLGGSEAAVLYFSDVAKIWHHVSWIGSIDGPGQPELEGRLAAAASRRGVSPEALAHETLARALGYDDWFIREVEVGLAQIDAGQTLTHEVVGTRLAKKLADHDTGR